MSDTGLGLRPGFPGVRVDYEIRALPVVAEPQAVIDVIRQNTGNLLEIIVFPLARIERAVIRPYSSKAEGIGCVRLKVL